jgi:hypothetical protein
MGNPANSLTAFLDGFSLSGLSKFARLPGGAESLVEETTDIRQSQFAELLMPFAKMKPSSDDGANKAAPGLAEPAEGGKASSNSELYELAVESFDIDQQIVAFLEHRGLFVDPGEVGRFRNRILAKALGESAKQSGQQAQRKNFA